MIFAVYTHTYTHASGVYVAITHFFRLNGRISRLFRAVLRTQIFTEAHSYEIRTFFDLNDGYFMCSLCFKAKITHLDIFILN